MLDKKIIEEEIGPIIFEYLDLALEGVNEKTRQQFRQKSMDSLNSTVDKEMLEDAKKFLKERFEDADEAYPVSVYGLGVKYRLRPNTNSGRGRHPLDTELETAMGSVHNRLRLSNKRRNRLSLDWFCTI